MIFWIGPMFGFFGASRGPAISKRFVLDYLAAVVFMNHGICKEGIAPGLGQECATVIMTRGSRSQGERSDARDHFGPEVILK
jgi:hypothetical protein